MYENNKSASPSIKDQIAHELGIFKDERVRFTYINSALVSAQNRQRFYVTNFGDISQPEDKGIALKDILESGVPLKEKAYCLDACYYKASDGTNPFNGHQSGNRLVIAEEYPLNTVSNGKSHTIKAQYGGNSIANFICNGGFSATGVAQRGRIVGGEYMQLYEARPDDKTNTLTTVQKDNQLAVKIGNIGGDSQAHRVYSPNSKSITLTANGGGQGGKTGLYAVPVYECSAGPVYTVQNGFINIKDRLYPIKLTDGLYIIRKLTVLECKRLQTVRDDYIMPCSDNQSYKMLGNGWTVDVIVYLLSHIPNIRNYDIEVLSMYDGMSCGNLALEKLGCRIAKYISYEIDKYAMQTAQANFPFIEQRGDAFKVRDIDWKY